ncbi:MAG: hypothetical protein S4CHLAM2_08130 [Chlamydiales bacterium]|nr:hypothetical protein [Chlamydiales bacterium]
MESTKSKRGSPSPKSSRASSYPRSRLFEEIILKSWWTILFFLLCCFAYDQAYRHKLREETRLQKKLLSLEGEIAAAQEKQDDLKLQIASQEDEAFIEMILMRKLGLVPEGQTKVHFITTP